MSDEFTKVSYEEITEDKKKFNERHPESMHKVFQHSEREKAAIMRALNFLANTQNGMDVDDYVVAENAPVYKYLKDDIIDKDVLLIGTGTGREMVVAKELGAARVEATTLGERNVTFAKEVVGVEPTLCDIHAMPWETGTFDIVAGFQVLEHSFMPAVFLLECNRLLKVGGMACMETPPSKTLSLDSWLHHIICPTPRQLHYLFQKTGFKPVEFNGVDISGVNIDEENDIEGLDDTSIMVCMKAIKQDPNTYERRDMFRYYQMLNGRDFIY